MPKTRIGKTEKDRKSGARARNADNKALRAAWDNDNHATAASFPAFTCNGKKNPYRNGRGR